MSEIPHSFIIKCTHGIPKIHEHIFRPTANIHYIDLASIIPCRYCRGRCILDYPEDRPGVYNPPFFLVCSQCGRPWYVEHIINMKNPYIELKVSIPPYQTGRQWYPNRSRERSISAYHVYVDDMLRLGEETIPFKAWADLQ